MFYLHMTPPVPAGDGTPGGSRLPTPSRPKSAAPAICVPTRAPATPATPSSIAVVASATALAKTGANQTALATPSPRSAAYVGFSPRAPSAPRPAAATPATTSLVGHFQHVLQAHGSTASPRRVSYGSVGQDPGRMGTVLPASGRRTGTANDGVITELQSSVATANVYHAMTARKSAEETAKQLARRIAHFRTQEEKVLCEVHHMKQRLENLLTTHDANEANNAMSLSRKPSLALKRPMSATTTTHASRMAQRSDLKAPRSREQLQFLTKQRRVLQNRNSESARQQKEKRQAALELQRQKEGAEQNRRAAIKARIQYERQLAIDERAARQQQLIDLLEQQHHVRLRHEQAREMEVQRRINDMREEEQNLALRLQALQVHQEYIKRGLEGSVQSPSPKRMSPPRSQSARPAPPPTLQTARPRVVPFASAPAEP